MENRILYIARNIPTPKLKQNQVILNIAKKLSLEFEIDILFPKEIVPWGFHFIPKYKQVYNLKPWKWNNKLIQILKYVRLPINDVAFKFCLQRHYLSKIENNRYDLIHCHYIFPDGIIATYFSKQWNIPFIITVRESDIDLLRKVSHTSSTWKWAENVLSQAKEILVLNKATGYYLGENFNINSTLLPHGLDSKNILPKLPDTDQGSIIEVSIVATATITKQIDWVIKALGEYKGNKRVHLSVIGSGAQLESLKSLAIAEDVNATFFGSIPHEQVFDRLKISDIFALPSRKESFGLVYLEAAATGNAIIGYKNTGIFGVLKDEKEIIYIDNFPDFKSKLFELIENREKRNELRHNAWVKVSDFTWDAIIRRYIKIYHKYLN